LIGTDRLRLRDIKRDYMFGSIWRDGNKSVKSVTVNSSKVVYQVLEQPEQLTDAQIVVVLKQRNKEKRIYEGATELIFEAGKAPTVEELNAAVKAKLEAKEDIFITKYVHHDFEWVELSRSNLEALIKRKKGKQQGKKGQAKKEEGGKKQEEVKQPEN
jgi:hypothetical protein